VILSATHALAGLKDIHSDKLPNGTTVLDAYKQLVEMESMVRNWQAEWRYERPKDGVLSRVNTSVRELQEAAKSASENEELLLLLGLAAHYSYNLDVQENYKVALDSLERAQKLAPQDYRPTWFLGIHLCQASQLKPGMDKFLSVERALPWEQLPAGFWDDYLECSVVTDMPAHALRAGAHATKLDPQPSHDRDFLLETAGKRFLAPDLAATYSAKQVWSGENSGAETVLTSSMFGLRLSSPGKWALNLPEVQKAFGMAQFQTGPHGGKSGKVFPNILVLVRPPKAGETLQDFFKAVAQAGASTTAPACPAQECLALTAVKPGAYKQEGDGHVFITVFKRDAPEFPGLLFEEPMALPDTKDGKVHYFHPNERLRRLEGPLYYLVMLDTASSVLQEAQREYGTFLKNMQVE
jgi:hypothetical protein